MGKRGKGKAAALQGGKKGSKKTKVEFVEEKDLDDEFDAFVETPEVTTEQISTVEDEFKKLLSDAPIVEDVKDDNKDEDDDKEELGRSSRCH